MEKLISSFMENIHENADPFYLNKKEEIKNNLRVLGLKSTAIFVASIAFAIFGIALTASSGSNAIIGFSIIFVSLPLCYLSYNICGVLKNMSDIVDSVKEYRKLFGFSQAFDKQKIKNKLEQGTFCFSWIVDMAVEEMAKLC